MKQTILFVVMAFLMLGCAGPASPAGFLTSTPHPILTATEAEGEPRATEPATSPTLPPTPEPPLKTEGPYLAFFRYMADQYQLVILDADGKGRKIVALPKEIMDSFMYDDHRPDTNLISPDGRWLAFYTGSAGSYTEMPAQGTADLALNLLDLKTGEVQVVTPLVSKEYPNNFAKAAEKLDDTSITTESLYQAFQYGIINSMAWSPDGRHLAFAGQMDGLSSDLYVYDTKTRKIDRLSSGDQELQWIDWSPDGKWILHGSVFQVGEGMSFDVYAAAADGSSVPYLSTSSLYGGITEWVNSHEYLEYDSENVIGDHGLRAVDINTGKVKEIWRGSFVSYGVDSSGKWIILMPLSPDTSPDSYSATDPNFKPGPYLIDLETMEKTAISLPQNEEAVLDKSVLPARSSEKIVLLNFGDQSYAFYISDTGEVASYELGNYRVSFSPDQNYWVAVSDQEIRVFDAENTERNKIPLFPGADRGAIAIRWRPDRSGLFLVSGSNIYSVDLQSNKIDLVETSLLDHFGSPQWIGG